MGKPELKPPGTPEEIEEARILREQGMTYKAIGQRMGRSSATVHRWCTQVEDPELVPAAEIAQHRTAKRTACIDHAYKVIEKLLKQVERDVDKKQFTAKHPAAVVLGILVDKLVALETADQRNPSNLPNGNPINIFAEIHQLGDVFQRAADGSSITRAVDGDIRPDDSAESIHPRLALAPPEAGGVPAGDEPEDGSPIH